MKIKNQTTLYSGLRAILPAALLAIVLAVGIQAMAHGAGLPVLIGDGACDPGTQSCAPGAGSGPGASNQCGPGNAGPTCGTTSPASQGSSTGINLGAGNPVNIITGNKYQREVDLPPLPGVLGLEIVRHYNSNHSGHTIPTGIFGRGWKLSYETELHALGRTVQILQADGVRVIFHRDPKDPSLCASGNPAHGSIVVTKTRHGDEYAWTWPDGRKLSFDHRGKLVQILAPTGEFVSLQHDVRGHLLKVTDPQGRSLHLHYLDKALAKTNDRFKGVVAIDSPAGRFGYDYGSALPEGARIDPIHLLANLARVRMPAKDGNSASRQYHYEDARHPTLLTGITADGAGSDGKTIRQRIASWHYDINARAILSAKGEPLRRDKDGQPVNGTGIEQVTFDRSEPGMTLVTNSLGQVTTYRHAIVGGEYRLLEARGPGCASCGETDVRYSYDALGRLTETIRLDATGQPLQGIRTALDEYGRPVGISKAVYRNGKPAQYELVTRYAYARHDTGSLPGRQPTLIVRPSVVPGKEHRVRIVYNDAQQPVKITESGWSPAVDGSGLATPIERTTDYRYTDINGRSLLERIDGPLPNGPSASPSDSDITLIRYDSRGSFPVEIVAPGNQASKITQRDDAGRPLSITAPGGVPLAYEYEPSGRITKVTKAGISEHLSYNALGQLAGVVQATGQRLYFSYGLDGRLTDLFDTQNNRIQIVRDTEGRLIGRSLFNPDGSMAQQGNLSGYIPDPQAPAPLGAEGFLQASATTDELTDAHGNTTHVHRAADGLPDAVVEPGNIAIRMAYDHLRRLTALTDARRLRTGYLYDDFGRLLRVDSPDAGVTVFTWDGADRLHAKTIGYGTAEASTISYRYDAAGRVIEQTSAEGKTTITYGPAGRPVDMAFPAGREQYEYDAAARLTVHTRIIDGHRFTTRYTYDERGQLKQKTLPDGQTLTYHYNGAVHPRAGLLNAITRKDLFGTTVLLDGLNDADDGYASQRMRLAHGIDYVRQLDRHGRLTRIGSPGAWEEQHRRDAVGHLAQRMPVGRPGMPGTHYAYDPLGRMTGIGRGGLPATGGTTASHQHDYRYDPSGNLLAHGTGNKLTRYAIDAASNRILAAHAGTSTQTYAYNAAGSISRIGDRTFTWDSQQRLVGISDAGKPVAEYRYNPFGERIRKIVHAGNQKKVSYYFYDGSHLTAEAEADEGAARITRQYAWLDDGNGARPIALLQARHSRLGSALSIASKAAGQAHSTDVYAIVTDHTGAPRAVVDEDRRTVWQAEVTGYGHIIPDSGNRISLHLRGSNQYHDDESGLHYNTRRYLDAHSGRYLSADPSGQAGGINLYVFAANNPIANVDPLGLQAKPVSGMRFEDKLQSVFGHAVRQLPGEIGDALKELVSPGNIATTVAIFGLWGASHAVGIGFLADIALVGMAYYSLGSAAIDFVKGIIDLVDKVNTARCEDDLKQAGNMLASASIMLATSVGNKGKSGGQAITSIFGGGKSKLSVSAPPSPPAGGKLVLHPTSIPKIAGDIIAAGLGSGKLKQHGPNDWKTAGGLRFKGLDGHGKNRVEHVAEHLTLAPSGKTKPHSIFTIPQERLLDLLDEAWKKAKVPGDPKDPGAFNIDLGRPLGLDVDGKTPTAIVRIIVKKGTNQIISAYPYKPKPLEFINK